MEYECKECGGIECYDDCQCPTCLDNHEDDCMCDGCVERRIDHAEGERDAYD